MARTNRSPVHSTGLPICELMPHHAEIMNLCTVIRTLTHGNGDHWAAAHWLLTGYLGATGADRAARNPSMSAISSHLLGPTARRCPSNGEYQRWRLRLSRGIAPGCGSQPISNG